MVYLPRRCRHCGHEAMVDYEHLESWPLDKVITAQGYVCEKCGEREAVFHSTDSMQESLRKVETCPPSKPKFQHLFGKALRKAEGLNRRGEQDGARKRSDLAPT